MAIVEVDISDEACDLRVGDDYALCYSWARPPLGMDIKI